jgi:hypothetical protein
MRQGRVRFPALPLSLPCLLLLLLLPLLLLLLLLPLLSLFLFFFSMLLMLVLVLVPSSPIFRMGRSTHRSFFFSVATTSNSHPPLLLPCHHVHLAHNA